LATGGEKRHSEATQIRDRGTQGVCWGGKMFSCGVLKESVRLVEWGFIQENNKNIFQGLKCKKKGKENGVVLSERARGGEGKTRSGGKKKGRRQGENSPIKKLGTKMTKGCV